MKPSLKDRVKMALAEVGYPDTETRGPDDWPQFRTDACVPTDPPLEVLWKAFVVAGLRAPCWECWDRGCCPEGKDEIPADWCDSPCTLDCGHDHEFAVWQQVMA